MILVSMTVISVLFVYKRNQVNMQSLMSTKINTIQALIENRVRQVSSWQDLRGQEFSSVLENIGNTTKSDITLYSPEGKVFVSTTPEVFDKMIIGSRIDQDAFHNICHMNQRFFIQRETIDDYSYWSMYAPVFNDRGEMIAIISSPYTDQNYDFRREAFFHAAMIVNLFLLLLLGTLLFSTREVNSMFSPLLEMGKKMNVADVHNLEYIIYKGDDEISSLVDAYNRMVHDLSDSTRQLARPSSRPIVKRTVKPTDIGSIIHHAATCEQALRRKRSAIAADTAKIIVSRITRKRPFSGIFYRRPAVILNDFHTVNIRRKQGKSASKNDAL